MSELISSTCTSQCWMRVSVIVYSGRILTVYELTDLFNMYITMLDEGQHDGVLR